MRPWLAAMERLFCLAGIVSCVVLFLLFACMPAFCNSCEVIVICMIAFLFRDFDLDLHDCWISNTALDISGYERLGSARTIRGRGGGNKQGRKPTDQIPQIIASTWLWLAILF